MNFPIRPLDSTEFIHRAATRATREQVIALERDIKDLLASGEIDPQNISFVLSPSNQVLVAIGDPRPPVNRDHTANGVRETRVVTVSFRNYIDVTNMTVGGKNILAQDGTLTLTESAIAPKLEKDFLVMTAQPITTITVEGIRFSGLESLTAGAQPITIITAEDIRFSGLARVDLESLTAEAATAGVTAGTAVGAFLLILIILLLL